MLFVSERLPSIPFSIILIPAADLEQVELNYDKVKRELETTLSELQEM